MALAQWPGEVVVERIAAGDVRAELGGVGAVPAVEPPAKRGIAATGASRAVSPKS